MKVNWNVNMLRRITFGMAAAAVVARWLTYFTAVDEKGLLTPWNWPGILLALITAATVAVVVVGCRGLTEDESPAEIIPGWIWSCVLALGIIVALLTGATKGDNLAKARYWLGWTSVPCLLASGVMLHVMKRPAFLLHTVVCLFFGLNLVDSYRLWSGEPQLLDYVFQMFGCAGLVLTAYQRTAFDVEIGNLRALRITELLTAFVCLVAAPDSGQALFYAAAGLWCLLGCHAAASQEVTDCEYS